MLQRGYIIYTLIISNLGSNPVRVGALFGSATFVNENNQININLFTGVIAGLVVIIGIGVITLIAGIIIVILDRRKRTRDKESIPTA